MADLTASSQNFRPSVDKSFCQYSCGGQKRVASGTYYKHCDELNENNSAWNNSSLARKKTLCLFLLYCRVGTLGFIDDHSLSEIAIDIPSDVTCVLLSFLKTCPNLCTTFFPKSLPFSIRSVSLKARCLVRCMIGIFLNWTRTADVRCFSQVTHQIETPYRYIIYFCAWTK